MNTPYTIPEMKLDDLDLKAWKLYQDANTAAKEEYIRRPLARPHISGHHLCLCCDILTEQSATICLVCQGRSPEWADLAADPVAIARIRRANKQMPAQLRRVVFA